VVVGNVPIGVAFFGHYTSKVGDVMTRFFETAFQVIPTSTAQLPAELAYQKNGVMFGNRLIQASRSANIADPQLRTDLIAFIYNCTPTTCRTVPSTRRRSPRAPTSGR
jgi:conjugal transfer mating pair stabilization protein TraG